jgi:hypothetical protein
VDRKRSERCRRQPYCGSWAYLALTPPGGGGADRRDTYHRPDPSGVLYEREVEELTRSEAFALVRDPDTQVAISHGSRPLRWLAPDERQTVWLEELAPNFHDEPNWKPPKGAPGQLPFHAELWKSGARRVVLVTDRD